MRQGVMKPKSHSSGVYWVRANANTGGGGKRSDEETSGEGFTFGSVIIVWLIVGIICAYIV